MTRNPIQRLLAPSTHNRAEIRRTSREVDASGVRGSPPSGGRLDSFFTGAPSSFITFSKRWIVVSFSPKRSAHSSSVNEMLTRMGGLNTAPSGSKRNTFSLAVM